MSSLKIKHIKNKEILEPIPFVSNVILEKPVQNIHRVCHLNSNSVSTFRSEFPVHRVKQSRIFLDGPTRCPLIKFHIVPLHS